MLTLCLYVCLLETSFEWFVCKLFVQLMLLKGGRWVADDSRLAAGAVAIS